MGVDFAKKISQYFSDGYIFAANKDNYEGI
jgi:hypothetical protein